jgi:polysulfide reductase-like protein
MTDGVNKDGLQNPRPDREALVGHAAGRSTERRWRRARRGEREMVPRAEFTSYYGKPVINQPVWQSPDIPGYLFLGGLAGASSVMAAGADLTGRPALARASKTGAVGAIALGAAGLVHDLGRPARFVNMLRVLKVTSPMSVGSWLLAGFGPATAVAAATGVTGRFPRLGAVSTGSAALIGPFVAAYTAALISDTAVPAWHEGHRELPYLFVASAASAAGGLGMLAAPLSESAPARLIGIAGAAGELAMTKRMEHRLGDLAQPYRSGTGGKLMKAAEAVTTAGVAVSVVGRRSRLAAMLGGMALLAGSALTRFGIFEAGFDSANDPSYTINPQRERLQRQGGHK